MNSNSCIDIVIPWVDGTDSKWRSIRSLYSPSNDSDSGEERYRDWGLLKYVFRGIEKYLPWVRKVHLITFGHLPGWLNTNNPKLHIVNHSDYIPEQWLPTFSSHPIELNIHRIYDLSEQFIYMNDDIFFLQPLVEEDFFVHGKPVSQAGLDVVNERDRMFTGILYSDLEVINRQFFSRKVLPKLITKFIHPKYGFKENFKSLLLLPWCFGYFPGFTYFHGPNAYLKRTFEQVWDKEEKLLSEVSSHKFRYYKDVNQYLFLWWQWCKGDFVPSGIQKKLQYVGADEPIDKIIDYIKTPRAPILCLNDAVIEDFDEKKVAINLAFDSVLGEKSHFEI